MKCSCGYKSVVKLEHGETEAQFLARRKCSNCNQRVIYIIKRNQMNLLMLYDYDQTF